MTPSRTFSAGSLTDLRSSRHHLMAAPTAVYVGMTNDEMHAFLKASCGVETCDIEASSLFMAATSPSPQVWASVRQELQLGFQASLDLQITLSNAVKAAHAEGKKRSKFTSKQPAGAEVDSEGNPMVNGVSIINGVCVDPSKPPDPKKATLTPFSFASMMAGPSSSTGFSKPVPHRNMPDSRRHSRVTV